MPTRITPVPDPAQHKDQGEQLKESRLLQQGRTEDSLVSLFERAKLRFPDRIAATCDSKHITYQDLDGKASGIAGQLLQLSDVSGKVVAIYMDRSLVMLATMLGVLKSGAAYLPIDPGYPLNRVLQTLEDAQPAIVVTNSRLAGQLTAIGTKLLVADDLATIPDSTGVNLPASPSASDLAYLMYTSGSTGKPKGVLVTHRNVVRLMTQTDPWFEFDENDVWTMFHSFAFDFSVWEIWGPLTTGGKLVIVPFAVSRSPEDFYALLSDQKVTVLNQTPSAFSLLCQLEDTGNTLPLFLRAVIFGGEALQYRSLRSWFSRHGETKPQLVNMYGITETTVHVTYRVVREADTVGEPDSLIGAPIPDLSLYLLDEDLKPVPDGETGEICVGGAGVTRGYLNRPELTAQRFVQDLFSTQETKLYRSGDLARRRPDGELVYLGRGDNQVKINGFRIELGEVEAAIGDYPSVQQVCVTAPVGEDGRQRLAAYFVMSGSTSPSAGELSTYLSKRLPPQMMPAFYTQLSAFPLTSNGKIDRALLPNPTAGSSSGTQADETAGTPMETQVASVWRHVLGAARVGVDENFFDIGGTSVLLVRVRSELQQNLGRTIPVTWMFEFTTIRALAAKLSEEGTSSQDAKSNDRLNAAQEQAKKQREAFARLRAAKGVSR